MRLTYRNIVGVFAIAIALLAFKWPEEKITIHSIGDSTMCNFDDSYLNKFGGEGYPIRGWMQMMPAFVKPSVKINNAAKSGRSSKSFRDEGWWDKVKSQIKPGDYVFIMFGGNDQKTDSLRHTDPWTNYKKNMASYVKETRALGAKPILFTSLVRRKFDKNGKLVDTYGEYILAVRALAKELDVPMIDLYQLSMDLVQKYGPEASKKLFLNIAPGRFSKLPEGKKDDSHLCAYGAEKVAELAVNEIKKQKLDIASYFK
ncbi:rhamnogalacturonan acetylesterase [Pedobacter nanyangensis]|uniref:rhamnogalacturonan acetylesterase n=1 Tax=Pedobacter nanyangensis TaxID=1562389 RepID=UPI000DE538AD|nr:rhamnogalacturonan acetylesterase [Pedobacter nanyangensis]